MRMYDPIKSKTTLPVKPMMRQNNMAVDKQIKELVYGLPKNKKPAKRIW